jgi:hypothetical protein
MNFDVIGGQRASSEIVVEGNVVVGKNTKFTRAAI